MQPHPQHPAGRAASPSGAPKKLRVGPACLGLLLLLAGLVSVVPVVSAAVTTENFDSYNDGSLPCSPTPIFAPPCTGVFGYAQSSSGTGSTFVQAATHEGASGSSLKITKSTGSYGAILNAASGVNLCATSINFSYQTLNAANQLTINAVAEGGGTSSLSETQYSLSFGGNSGSGAETAQLTWINYNHATATSGSTPVLTLANTASGVTFYHISVYCPSTAAGGTVVLSSPEATALGNGPVSTTVPANPGADYAVNRFTAFYPTNFIYLDNLVLGAAGAAATPAIGAAATSPTFTGITGADVDPSFNTLILRTDGGTNVRTLDVGTMTGSSVINTGCTRTNGVSVIRGFTAFFNCWGSPGNTPYVHLASDVQYLSIRSSSLGTPTLPNICVASTFCDLDIDARSVTSGGALDGDQDIENRLKDVQAFPYDFTQSSTTGLDHVYAAWGVTDTQGNVGIVTYVWKNQDSDVSHIKLTSVSATAQAPDTLCTVLDPDGKEYIYASSQTSTAKGFQVIFSKNDGRSIEVLPGSSTADLDVSQLVTSFPGTASTANANSLGCGSGHFVIGTQTQVMGFTRGAVSALWTKTVTGTTTNGISESQDGRFAEYVSAGSWHIVNTTTGAEVVSGAMPSGTVLATFMQGAGSGLVIVTGTNAYRYDIFPYTTGTDTGYIPPCADGTQACNTNPTGTGTGSTGTSGSTGLTLTAADGFCLVCAYTNTGGSILIDKTTGYIIGFVFVAATVALAIGLARKNNASISGPVSGVLVGIGMGGAYLLFLFPLFIIILCALLAAAAILTSRKSGTGA